jgi:hypothetical protein
MNNITITRERERERERKSAYDPMHRELRRFRRGRIPRAIGGVTMRITIRVTDRFIQVARMSRTFH